MFRGEGAGGFVATSQLHTTHVPTRARLSTHQPRRCQRRCKAACWIQALAGRGLTRQHFRISSRHPLLLPFGPAGLVASDHLHALAHRGDSAVRGGTNRRALRRHPRQRAARPRHRSRRATPPGPRDRPGLRRARRQLAPGASAGEAGLSAQPSPGEALSGLLEHLAQVELRDHHHRGARSLARSASPHAPPRSWRACRASRFCVPPCEASSRPTQVALL